MARVAAREYAGSPEGRVEGPTTSSSPGVSTRIDLV
jgi:hypothetical protein